MFLCKVEVNIMDNFCNLQWKKNCNNDLQKTLKPSTLHEHFCLLCCMVDHIILLYRPTRQLHQTQCIKAPNSAITANPSHPQTWPCFIKSNGNKVQHKLQEKAGPSCSISRKDFLSQWNRSGAICINHYGF